jgi:hypothetical protein
MGKSGEKLMKGKKHIIMSSMEYAEMADVPEVKMEPNDVSLSAVNKGYLSD